MKDTSWSKLMMKEVNTISKAIPFKARSGNYSGEGTSYSLGGASIDISTKLDKVIWDRNLEERVDDNGEEYLFLTKPLITAYGVTMYSGADVQVPSIYEGLPIDGVTIQWVDGKLVATGGKGTANGIVVNGNTYTPNEDGIITLPNYPTSLEWGNISGKPSWIGSTKPSYSWDEIGGKPSVFPTNWENVSDKPSWIGATKPAYDFSEIQNKPTTIAGYGITDAYTKNDISGLLADYVTKSGAQDITGIKSFINGLNIGDILVKKHSDGVVELDGDLILTGSLTMFAQGSHTASTILDALPIDETTLSKEGDVLSVIGGVGGGSVDGIILNGTTYSPDETTKLITLPNYPTTLPANDVYSWAKQPNKPSYSFDELSSHPTTLGGYGITDAYTKSDADGRFFRYFGYTTDDGNDFMWQKLGTFTYLNAFPDGVTIKRHGYGQVTSFIAGSSRFQLYSTHSSSDPNDGSNGIQFRSGWDDDKKSWRMLLDEVNYLHYTDNRYVNKIGDAMTGNLVFAHTSERPSYSGSIGITFREQIANGQGVKLVYNDYDNYRAPAGLILVGEQGGEYFEAPAIYQNGYKVWDAGNDGSGSGLDADLLDGYHESDFVRSWWTDSPGYNCSTHNIRPLISFTYKNSAPFSGGFIDVSTNGYGFYLGTGYSSDQSLYYRRHGGPSDGGMGSWQQLARVTDNIASATKLQTPRSLWGQTFDGTGNVNGTIHVNSGGIYPIILRNSGGSECSIDYQCSGEHFVAGVYPDRFFIWRENGGEIASFLSNGNVGIGTTSPSCKLHVKGDILATGGITMYSDLRKKNVLNSIIVPLDVMANADLFDYTFKTDEKCKVRAGTSAQYWNVFLPQVTDTDNEGFFTMSYDVLATTCVLSMAKHFQRFLMEDFNNHETRIEFLERENKELKDSNKEMMNRIIELERRAA